AWRPAHEQLALQAKGVVGLVMRLGCGYGGRGGLTGDWFAAAAAGKAPTVVGSGHNRWTMVHLDDLADAYVRAAESGRAGEVFDVTDRSRATVLEMATAAARAAGGASGGSASHDGRFRGRACSGPACGCPQRRAAARLAAAPWRLRGRGRHFLRGLEGVAGVAPGSRGPLRPGRRPGVPGGARPLSTA